MKQSNFKLRGRKKITVKIWAKVGIVAGKFYNCEWMAADTRQVTLNVGQKSLEARQDEKESNVFVQWLTRGSRGKWKRWQKYLH